MHKTKRNEKTLTFNLLSTSFTDVLQRLILQLLKQFLRTFRGFEVQISFIRDDVLVLCAFAGDNSAGRHMILGRFFVVVGEFIFFIFVSNPTMRKGRSQTFFVFFVFVFFVFFVFFFFFFERKRGKLRSFQVSFQLTQKEVGVVETNSFEPS